LKTGILPTSEGTTQVDTDTSSNNQQINELQDLINQFSITEASDKLDAVEFITIDNDNGEDTEITDEDIISCVRPIIQTETEDDNVVLQTITTTEVLKSLDTVTSYIKNPPQTLFLS